MRRAAASPSAPPLSTSWPGALSLATTTPCAAARRRAWVDVAPISASIVPPPAASPASAISRPRSALSRSALSSLRTPAAASAASSPREWPASACGRSAPAQLRPARQGCRADRRLGEARALGDPGEGILPRGIDRHLEKVGADARDEVAHALGLGPLPREQDSGRSRCEHIPIYPDRRHRGYAVSRDTPRSGGSIDAARGVRPATQMRPSRCARWTASARLRTPSLRYRRLVCSLTVCGERCSCSAISRLVEPSATRLRTSRSRSVRGGAEGSVSLSNTVMPSPTMRTASAMSPAGQSLGTKPAAPAARAAAAEIAPAPEISSTLVPGESVAQLLAYERAGLLADEQVHERHLRLEALREGLGLGTGARAQAALDPRLLAEHDAKAPVDDVVIVDDEHPQAPLAGAVARGDGAAACRWPHARLPAAFGTTSRTCHQPVATWPELHEASGLERRECRQAQADPHHAAWPPGADAVVGDPQRERPVRLGHGTSIVVGSACLRAFAIASVKTAWASGSRPAARRPGRPSTRTSSSGCAARRSTSSRSVARVSRGIRPERALERLAQVGERSVDLVLAALALLRRERLGARGQRQRDAEQALHDAVVDVAGEVDALLEGARPLLLERRDPRAGGERRDLAQRPQPVGGVVGERGVPGAALREDHADHPARRAHGHADQRPLVCERQKRFRARTPRMGGRARSLGPPPAPRARSRRTPSSPGRRGRAPALMPWLPAASTRRRAGS